jgi:hypothetical protein
MFGILPAAKCPTATLDVALNLKNRQKCIKTAMYGPANPRLPNLLYWQRLANVWGVSVKDAQTMRCGNCAAFDIKRNTIECIKQGIGRDGIDPQDTVVAAELGYCRMFQFKCAASRTCSAWIVGGPIR